MRKVAFLVDFGAISVALHMQKNLEIAKECWSLVGVSRVVFVNWSNECASFSPGGAGLQGWLGLAVE